jgi:hypothetical protein
MATLWYHREMAAMVFGPDSPAVKFLDKKIAESPNGEKEEVLVSEEQLIMMLSELHNKGEANAEAPLDVGL